MDLTGPMGFHVAYGELRFRQYRQNTGKQKRRNETKTPRCIAKTVEKSSGKNRTSAVIVGKDARPSTENRAWLVGVLLSNWNPVALGSTLISCYNRWVLDRGHVALKRRACRLSVGAVFKPPGCAAVYSVGLCKVCDHTGPCICDHNNNTNSYRILANSL
ncbi:hypothetical protein D9C73_022274 [Collichthys lucidus]|uniref:Uncharacterized protein n=1 Tax=Collichthys lucidus TaxID=240159 RepID=A0A4U5VK06_COLLU|nr:hypothetical protein D9C73_022274 [Collichthys lucidus]